MFINRKLTKKAEMFRLVVGQGIIFSTGKKETDSSGEQAGLKPQGNISKASSNQRQSQNGGSSRLDPMAALV